jgi:Helix-turn-helix domain
VPRELWRLLERSGYVVSYVQRSAKGRGLPGRRASAFEAEVTIGPARSDGAATPTTKRTEARAMTLRGLRESVGRTQGDVARRVSMTQPQLSRVEGRRDHLTSTLRKYVQALGGRIEVAAVVKRARIVLQDV